MEDVHNSGGIHTILGSVAAAAARACLHLDCPTVSGKTLGENIAEYDVRATTAAEEALELAAVTAGGQRTTEGMSSPRKAGSIRDLSPRAAGLRSLRLHPRGRQGLQRRGRAGDPLRQPGPARARWSRRPA